MSRQQTSLSKPKKVAVVCILLTSFLMGFFSLRGDSAIVDEIAHIPAGYNYVVDQDYRLNPEHPPLMKALSGLPLAFLDLTFPYDLYDWREAPNGQWESGWKFLYERGNDPDQILFWARLPILFSFLVLLVFVFVWARQLWGDGPAFLALTLAAFSPNLLAHARYVTTDMGVAATFFIAVYAFWRFVRRPSWKLLLWATVAFAVAQLAKFSNVLLPVYLVLLSAVLLVVWRKRLNFAHFPLANRIKQNWLQRTWVLGASLVFLFMGGFLLVWLAYVPFVWNTPADTLVQLVDFGVSASDASGLNAFLKGMVSNDITKSFGVYLLGLFMVFGRVAGGNTTYFLGEVTNQSFWYFYPVSFLMKTPIPMLIGAATAAILAIRGFRRTVLQKTLHIPGAKRTFLKRWHALQAAVDRYLAELIFFSAIAMFMLVGMVGNLNIGLRHILPLYPFLIMLVAKYVAELWRGARGRFRLWKAASVLALLVWYVGGTVFAYPHFLSYFNLVVGRDHAYNYTTDSNVDWGQDLKRLAQWAEEEDIEELKVDYFGGGVPEYYLGDRFVQWRANNGETTGWIAVSATFFKNSQWYSQCCGERDYRWLEAYEPVTVIGGSILVFNIPESS